MLTYSQSLPGLPTHVPGQDPSEGLGAGSMEVLGLTGGSNPGPGTW